MREIKFRGWNGKEMLDVYYVTRKGIGALGNGGMIIPKDGESRAIMQFTGLTDINGVEIYEGDILKSDIGLLWLVSFGSRGGFVAHEKNDIDDFVLLDDYDFTIIGNIYKNQELLK